MKPDKKRQSQQAFDQQAATYDTDIQGSHARTLYPYMLQEITHAWGDRVLDLGCGTGALTAQVLEQDPRRQVTGLDLSEQMLAQARARLGDRVKLIQGDSECLPFPDGSFDVVYCCDSFHHYPDPAAVLALFHRADVVFKRSFSAEKNQSSILMVKVFPKRRGRVNKVTSP